MRLVLFPNEISKLRRQQDGKTLYLSKKGCIYMYTHAHAHEGLVSKKCVLRLADALSSAMSGGGVTTGKFAVVGSAARP
jgi:hypothetical protein